MRDQSWIRKGFVVQGIVVLTLSFFGSSSLAQDSQKLNDLSFDDLVFDMEATDTFKRSMLTEQITNYHKSTVRLRGFIRPTMRQENITKFIFVRDNKECCFGPGAALYDCVLVQMAEGTATDFTVRPITIRGDFFLREYKGPDGKVWAIYRMKNAIVE